MPFKTKSEVVSINPPNLLHCQIVIQGISPYVQCKFSQEALQQMHDAQEAGSTGKKGKLRVAKDFQAQYEQACHVSSENWYGIPAPSFRNAMISACKLVGYVMTRAKLAIFIEPDGFDRDDHTPLVKFSKGEPHYFESYVRLANGAPDLRARPMWDVGWEAVVKIVYDADQMTLSDVTNLLGRVGLQVGIGCGRPDSKTSCGQGWGLFQLKNGE
jgi:hypothetical protein